MSAEQCPELAEKLKPYLLSVDGLDWDLVKPCNDCPFLKSSPFHEGVASSLPTYVESIENHTFAHTCHKTDNRPSVDGPKNFAGDRPKHCAGAIICLMKTGEGMDLQLPLLEAAERAKLSLERFAEIARRDCSVHTIPSLLKFYEDGLAERLSRRDKQKRARQAAAAVRNFRQQRGK